MENTLKPDPPKETQAEREARCHKEADEYYRFNELDETAKLWFHRGIEFGAKWVDNGDKVSI